MGQGQRNKTTQTTTWNNKPSREGGKALGFESVSALSFGYCFHAIVWSEKSSTASIVPKSP